MLPYLASLPKARIVLWCYLVWYLTIVALYFPSFLPLWLSSLGMSIIVGTALILSTYSKETRFYSWPTFRLFLMPFCVSSYSASVVGKGFILIFPPRLYENAIGLGACVAFLLLQRASRYFATTHSVQS